MARNDGILDLDAMIGKDERDRKFFSSGNQKYNPRIKIYYNSDNDVLTLEEILYLGTPNEITYSQTYYYTDVTNSGVDHVTTIEPWVVL